MELDFRTLDPNDESTDHDLLVGYVTAVNRGFHLSRPDERAQEIWLDQVRADGARLHGAWLPSDAYGASNVPVATVASWPGDINTGAQLLGLHMISDVTVSPASRRQGLASRLISQDLELAVSEGKPLAALTVSEGSIYRRFGFGPATFRSKYEVDVTGQFAFEEFTSTGRFVHLEPSELGEVPDALFTQWHATHRGSVSRSQAYEPFTRGEWSWDEQGPEPKMRAVVHLDADDQPHGYALYAHGGWGNDHTVTVRDMLALTPEGHLSLWDFLAGIDLTDRVVAHTFVDNPLPWALVDNRCVSAKGPVDSIWLRVLDVVAALEGRPWYADGDVVLGISDRLGHAEGNWHVVVRDGRASVTRTDAAAQVSMAASALGSLYLSSVPTATLVQAARVTGEPDAIATWAGMCDGGPTPYSQTTF